MENPNPPSGGSSGVGPISVEQHPVDVPEEPEGSEEGGDGPSEAELAINGAMVEVAATTVGRVAAAITRIPEMEFDEAEVEQLKALWAPLVPEMSPMTTALVGTLIIVAGKVSIYMAKRKEIKGVPLQKADQIALDQPLS